MEFFADFMYEIFVVVIYIFLEQSCPEQQCYMYYIDHFGGSLNKVLCAGMKQKVLPKFRNMEQLSRRDS